MHTGSVCLTDGIAIRTVINLPTRVRPMRAPGGWDNVPHPPPYIPESMTPNDAICRQWEDRRDPDSSRCTVLGSPSDLEPNLLFESQFACIPSLLFPILEENFLAG